MPAKKIIEAVASTFTVIGSSMGNATAGQIPGSTPTGVPKAQPTEHQSRLTGGGGSGKGLHQLVKDIHLKPPGRCKARQIDHEEFGEYPVHRSGNRYANQCVFKQRNGFEISRSCRDAQALYGQHKT